MGEVATELLTRAGWWMAAFFLSVLPAALLFWLLIHPFARFWRKRRPAVTYTVVGGLCLAVVAAIFPLTSKMLAVRWPFRWWLLALGLLVYVAAAWVEIQCRRHLKLRTLVGAPEVGGDPGRVLREGIYGRLRHPRYLAVLLGMVAWAFILNYPAMWILALASVPGFYLVILVEERELRERFGAEYEEYMRAVPRRLLPRLGR